MRLPPLGSLRAFTVAARHRSIVAAAVELNVTHGAVSKQIQLLEQELGVALFVRRNRGIHLTPDGHWLAERLGAVFADLEQTMRDFRREGVPPGPLTISCEPTLCLRMLIPALPDLKKATGLNIRVLAAGGPIDFRRDHVDIAIRRSDFVIPPSVDVAIIAPEYMGPVMIPPLAHGNGENLPRLHSDTRPDAWDSWSQGSGTTPAGPDIRYEHFYLALQAAEAGQGIAIASLHMVRHALEGGQLVAPYGFIPDGTEYLAIHPKGLVDEQADDFLAWLTRYMSSSCPQAQLRDSLDKHE